MNKTNKKQMIIENKYNMEFKTSGISFDIKGINDNKKRIFVSMKNLLSLL